METRPENILELDAGGYYAASFQHPVYANEAMPLIYTAEAEAALPWLTGWETSFRTEEGLTIITGDPTKPGLPLFVETDPRPAVEAVSKALASGSPLVYIDRPCRIAALPTAGIKSENLFSVDIRCRGALPFQIYQAYLAEADPPDEHCLTKILNRGLGLLTRCALCPFNRFPRQGDMTIGREPMQQLSVALNNKKAISFFEKYLKRVTQFSLMENAVSDRDLTALQPRFHRNRRLFFEMLGQTSLADNLSYNLDGRCDCIIFNFWHGLNYGGILTAYGLQESLKALGYLPRLGACYVDNLHNGSFSERFAARYLALTYRCSNHLEVESLNKLTDTFIVGSDQVWRPEFNRHYNNLYSLNFAEPGKKKIACAASFGLETFKPGALGEISTHLRKFDKISVREESGQKICHDLIGIEADILPDPVFGPQPEKYENLAAKSSRRDKKFMAVYEFTGEPWIMETIAELSAKLNLRAVFLRDIEVEDWLYLIKNCDFMASWSFHGVCFALMFNKAFLCSRPLSVADTSSRLHQLLDTFNLQDRFLRRPEDLAGLDLTGGIDFQAVNNIISQQRRRLLIWLDHAMKSQVASDKATVV